MKPLRRVKPDPKDPTWTFPYARRETMEKILVFFDQLRPNKYIPWRGGKTHALPIKEAALLRKTTPWPSVPPRFRPQVDAWFHKKLKQVREERGVVTWGKIQSLRMNAACFGRYVLTMKRNANRTRYERRKRLYFAYLEWTSRRPENLAKKYLE